MVVSTVLIAQGQENLSTFLYLSCRGCGNIIVLSLLSSLLVIVLNVESIQQNSAMQARQCNAGTAVQLH